MQQGDDSVGGTVISEMAVVDTFTRLIFGEIDHFGPRELSIIELFRQVDDNVLMDNHEQMGAYLRELGVREMIHLVARIHEESAASGSRRGDYGRASRPLGTPRAR